MKEKDIIELLQSGKSEKAFAQLYKFYPKVRSVLKKYGSDKEQTNDIFQDALVVLFQKFSTHQFQITTSIESYLTNTCKYMYLKSQKSSMNAEQLSELMDEEVDMESKVLEDRKKTLAESALQQLGDKCKELLVSFYIRKKSMTEIADEFSFTSENAAKTQKYKCMEAVRKTYYSLIKNTSNNSII